MTTLARKNIQDLKPYEPGKPIKELERELGIKEKDIIKLASNENPIGPSPLAVRAISMAIKSINRYPDGSAFYLKRDLSKAINLKPENIVLGNGSDELIDIISKAFLEEKDEVIISDPAFLEYGIITKTRGSRIKEVALEGLTERKLTYNIKKIINSINKKTKVIFLGNPDNPTGAYLNNNQLRQLLSNCPNRVIIVFDEAYREFVDKKDYSNPADFINKKNIIILRTFSKAYGLAGLRIGYAIAGPKLCEWMERARLPFNVNLLAQVAAESALDDTAHLLRTKRLIRKGKLFLVKSLKRLGFDIIESPANFLLFSYKGLKGTEIFKRLLPQGVIVRDMKAYGLSDWARVNVGTMDENRRFIVSVRRLLRRR
jgi:histidinol-phosphate aminotransferase